MYIRNSSYVDGMSVIIDFERSYYFTTSNPSADAIVSADGSKLSLTLDSPGISIPKAAMNATFEVENATIWNTSPNISAARANNKFTYLLNGVAQPVITITDGLYSLSSLGVFLSREFVNRGQDSKIISFAGDDSTQKVIITFAANVQADFTNADSVGRIMGFDTRLVPTTPINNDGHSEDGDTIAVFNIVNNFTIISNLIGEGIPINNSGISLMAVIQIPSGSTGKQVNYSPNHPTKVDAMELAGNSRQRFQIEICDQNGTPVPQKEFWSVLIVLRYGLLMTNSNVPMLNLQ